MKEHARRRPALDRRSFLKAGTLGGSATALAAALGIGGSPASAVTRWPEARLADANP